jgi:hypothetical protein
MIIKRNNINTDLLFGKDRAQEDANLSKYFVKTDQYLSIYNGNKELVLGRKGSGKSAIFSQMCKELPQDGIIPIEISPQGEDFVFIDGVLEKYGEYGFDDDFKYSLSWYEFIVTQIAFTLISDIRVNPTQNPQNRDALYQYLKKNEKVNGDFVTQFTNALLKVFSNGKIKSTNVELDVDLSVLKSVGTPEQEQIKAALTELITHNRFFVLVDNLDEPWKNTPKMNSWLRGLILAARKLKRDFNNLKIVIFLRDDIFFEIKKGSDLFDSRNELLYLNWKDNYGNNLRKLIASRIASYFGKPMPETPDECDVLIELIYPREIDYRTSNKNMVRFVADFTFYKPREFLQLLRIALENSTSSYLPIPAGAIRYAERQHSNWKVSQVEGEYSKTYSNIANCIESFAGIRKEWKYPYQDLLKHLRSLSSDKIITNCVTNNALSPEETINLLFLIGFLRKVIINHRNPSRTPNFHTYLDESNPNLRGCILDIHPSFRQHIIHTF